MTDCHRHPLCMPDASLPPYLTPDGIDTLVRRELDDDLGPGDVTTEATVSPGQPARARVVAKEGGIVAGLPVAARTFAAVDDGVAVRWQVDDGAAVDAGHVVGQIEGPARALLIAERTALNLLQRMSGIATATRRMVEAAAPHGAEILDTRKTAPGLRRLDKWAVRLGGGTNHRLGLHDLILIKDNHIAAAGGVGAALQSAARYRSAHDAALQIEIETRTLDEVDAALSAGLADILLLDNMVTVHPDGTVDTSMLEAAVQRVDGQARTEASGNVTLGTVAAIAATGVDAISSGALTHSVQALDLSIQMTLQ